VNEDNLSIRREASRHFRNKKRKYLKEKINELEPKSKNKNIRDLCRCINEFKKGYQPRTIFIKDEKGNLLVDPHKIVNRCMNYFCQQLPADWGYYADRNTESRAICTRA
jgi:C4-type Zn-finger protein